ncbi:MAG: hypothetical protein J2P30_01485 [Actinobacteria bacterium]|nr:hypothetical protein [Actinomycetota bacterium]
MTDEQLERWRAEFGALIPPPTDEGTDAAAADLAAIRLRKARDAALPADD